MENNDTQQDEQQLEDPSVIPSRHSLFGLNNEEQKKVISSFKTKLIERLQNGQDVSFLNNPEFVVVDEKPTLQKTNSQLLIQQQQQQQQVFDDEDEDYVPEVNYDLCNLLKGSEGNFYVLKRDLLRALLIEKQQEQNQPIFSPKVYKKEIKREVQRVLSIEKEEHKKEIEELKVQLKKVQSGELFIQQNRKESESDLSGYETREVVEQYRKEIGELREQLLKVQSGDMEANSKMTQRSEDEGQGSTVAEGEEIQDVQQCTYQGQSTTASSQAAQIAEDLLNNQVEVNDKEKMIQKLQGGIQVLLSLVEKQQKEILELKQEKADKILFFENQKQSYISRVQHQQQLELIEEQHQQTLQTLQQENQQRLLAQKQESERKLQIEQQKFENEKQDLERKLQEMSSKILHFEFKPRTVINVDQFVEMCKAGFVSNVSLTIDSENLIKLPIEIEQPLFLQNVDVRCSQETILQFQGNFDLTIQKCNFKWANLGIFTTKAVSINEVDIRNPHTLCLAIQECKSVHMYDVHISDSLIGCSIASCRDVQMDSVSINRCCYEALQICNSKVQMSNCMLDSCEVGIKLYELSEVTYDKERMYGQGIKQRYRDVSKNSSCKIMDLN
eukprot:TRINITY_DN220_c0_g1_i2.p1 TRINITY_DN220_c0_g1~~TRINITY_DN220_c0_g1_i2.p1  ORF type:complete len:637 (+),score=87.71 TRINITY_DN220_c0_g1_i2:72-1913(+)